MLSGSPLDVNGLFEGIFTPLSNAENGVAAMSQTRPPVFN